MAILGVDVGGTFTDAVLVEERRIRTAKVPTIATAVARGKVTPAKALLHQHKAPKEVKALFDKIDGKEERNELNLYVSGYEDDPKHAGHSDEPTPQTPPQPEEETT